MVRAQCLNTRGLLGAAGLSLGRRPDPALKDIQNWLLPFGLPVGARGAMCT